MVSKTFYDQLDQLLLKNKDKGGSKKMETKSRYEVIADLEKQKRTYMQELHELRNRELRLQHQIEELQTELKEFQAIKTEQENSLKDLIESVDKSLARFENLSSQKKQN